MQFYQEIEPENITEQFLWDGLLPSLRYLNTEDQNSVHKALRVAYHAHDGQYRKSGEPFITHPVEVCRILAELGAEPEMLMAGLLHDTVEDTDRVCLDSIRQQFGPDCAQIVEGETKFSKLGELHADMTKEELQVCIWRHPYRLSFVLCAVQVGLLCRPVLSWCWPDGRKEQFSCHLCLILGVCFLGDCYVSTPDLTATTGPVCSAPYWVIVYPSSVHVLSHTSYHAICHLPLCRVPLCHLNLTWCRQWTCSNCSLQ